ncbi:hypothetical protein WK52_00280 [Burkholderia multivorans]|nr:hypothetical protein WK52_00280 [Burkholderia multivorans]
MIDSDDWQSLVSTTRQTVCPACNSTKVTAGAYELTSAAVYQEYICEDCQYQFTGLFTLAGYSPSTDA